MGLKDLTKNTFILAGPSVVNFMLRIVKAKLNALLLGTYGVGIINQVQGVNTKLGGFATLALPVGARKQLVSHDNQKGAHLLPSIILLFFLTTLVLTLIVFVGGLIFKEEVSTFFLGKEAREYFLYLFIFIPFLTLDTVSRTIMGAFQSFSFMARSQFISLIVGFLLFLPMIYFYGLIGVLISLGFNLVFTFALNLYFSNRSIRTKNIRVRWSARLDFPKVFKEFSLITGVSSILGLLTVVVELVNRGVLVNAVGIDQIGLYAPLITWSAIFSTFFLPSLFQYIFPRYGQCESNEELRSVANDAFRMITFLIIPFILIVISTSRFTIPALYSKEFAEARTYFPLHFTGILFWSWMRILKQMFIPTGRLKQLTPFVIAEEVLYLIVIIGLVSQIGLWAWTIRFSLVPLALFIGYFIYLFRAINFRIEGHNLILMLYGTAMAILISWVDEFTPWSVIPAIGAAGSLWFFMRKKERAFASRKLMVIRKKLRL